MTAWHGRYFVVTTRYGKIDHIFPRERHLTEETNGTFLYMILGMPVYGRRVADSRLSIESQPGAVIVPLATISMVEFITENKAEVPLFVCTPLGSEVSCEQVIKDIVLRSVVFNLAFLIISRAYLCNGSIVGGIDINAGLLTKDEIITVVPIHFRSKFGISIAKYAVRML